MRLGKVEVEKQCGRCRVSCLSLEDQPRRVVGREMK